MKSDFEAGVVDKAKLHCLAVNVSVAFSEENTALTPAQQLGLLNRITTRIQEAAQAELEAISASLPAVPEYL